MNTENVIELINSARKNLERIDDENCYSLSMDIDKLLDFALKELKDEYTLYVPKNKNIDRRTKNIVHLSDGSIKYDFNKYNSYIEAIYADYIDCRTDEQLKESISLCFSDSLDQKVMFKKLKLQFLSALANTDKA